MDVEREQRLVCEDCIGEALLRREIVEHGVSGACMCCRAEEQPAVTLEWLAERVKPTYELLVTRAPEEIRFYGDRTYTEPNGESPSDVLAELIQAEDRDIAVALIAIMGRGHEWRFRDGGFDIYDDSAEELTIEEPDGSALRHRWLDFCTSLKHERRFFNAEGVDVLDEVFRPILRGEHPGNAVRVFGPDDPDRFIYRARQANDDNGRRPIFERLINQLSAPTPGVSGAGRMNAAGIAVFYGSFDVETCVAELRVPVGGAAIVGRFEVLRPLRILDLTRLAATAETLSYFDPRYAEARSYADFIEGFHQEIRRAVIPGRETLDYLPTQIVAEYLWSQADPPVDGIIFGSAQISETANNIVLFPHASTVEGAEGEARRTIHGLYRYATHDEDEEVVVGQLEQHVVFEPVPQPPEPKPRDTLPFGIDDDWFSGVTPVEAQPAALRLLIDQVSIVEVTGIHFSTDSVPIRFSDQEDHGF
jgi:hypothetical protein